MMKRYESGARAECKNYLILEAGGGGGGEGEEERRWEHFIGYWGCAAVM